MLHHLLSKCEQLSKSPPIIICGYQAELLKSSIDPLFQVSWKFQQEQLGTAHAVKLALDEINNDDTVIVAAGDVPLTSLETFQSLLEKNTQSQMSIVTQHLNDASGYGRIKRDQHGEICGIVEHKDASADELEISEINTGIMAFPGKFLKEALPEIKNNNAQNEYYLTDIVELAQRYRVRVEAVHAKNHFEIKGINSRKQQVELEREYQYYLAERYMNEYGVTFVDPHRVDFRGESYFESDVEVDVNVIFEGENKIAKHTQIGAHSILKNVVLEEGVIIEAMCHLEGVIVRKGAVIGPYARLRPGADIGEDAKIGNFVEVKKSTFGKRSKANHLAYIGDANIGQDVNIGAGTITCNYDGANKHQTTIEDGAFIGSNSALVAPVTVGTNSTIGAGTTLVNDAPANKLSLSRAKQRVIEKWIRPRKQQ